MLESLRIQGFRKFRSISLDGFDQINFILGNNNVGKTSILEAIYAWACGNNVLPFVNIPLSRSRHYGEQNPYWMMEELLATVNKKGELPLQMVFDARQDGKQVSFSHRIYPSDLLTEYDSSYKNSRDGVVSRSNDYTNGTLVQIPGISPIAVQPTIIAHWEVRDAQGSKSETDITVPQIAVKERQPHQLAKFIDVLSHTVTAENVQMYSLLKRERLLHEVAQTIGASFPEVADFDVIPYPDGSQAPISVVRRDGTMLPLYAHGDGVQKWFYVLGAMCLYRNAIVCIDEVDSGLHPNAQVGFSLSVARNAVKNGVQLFLTTHNIEFMDHFLEEVAKSEHALAERVRVITLREVNGEVRVRNIGAKEACEARDSYNLELR